MVGSPQDIDCIVNTTVPGVSSVSVSWTGPGGVPYMSRFTNKSLTVAFSPIVTVLHSCSFSYVSIDHHTVL